MPEGLFAMEDAPRMCKVHSVAGGVNVLRSGAGRIPSANQLDRRRASAEELQLVVLMNCDEC